MTRSDFQRIAEERIADAAALLTLGRWSGAYYLAGYAVECGLKACVAKMTREFDFPDRDRAQKGYTHNLVALVDLARLTAAVDADCAADSILARNWATAKDWNERARYELWSEADARRLVAAVSDPSHGVLPWITARW